MGICAQASRIGTYRTGDVLEGLLAKVGELDRDLAVDLVVCGRRDADAPGLRDALEPCRYVDTVSENIFAFDQDVAEIDPDPEQHLAINRYPFVPLGHHLLHSHRTLHRIDHRRKLK